MRNLIIFGDTPFAERIATYIEIEGEDKVIAFAQEADFITRSLIMDLPVLPFEELLSHYEKDTFSIILAIGYSRMNQLREKIYSKCLALGYHVASYISTRAIVYQSEVGDGTVILPGTLIGPNCKIGKGNYIASSCTLSHDNILGDFNFLSTNVVMGGHAKIMNHCFCGLHATIRDSIIVDDYSLLGSCANLTKSTNNKGMVYVGNPAKPIDGKVSTETKI